ncbi:HDL087Cp [Eremothecium sinecaudum]|uniref:HDL087Cp n=1 Tax=Eremothecium sinecaudum TaxID=45286 RepID=A0A109UX19_9SACH|nr:HDL087Cp [Eremothecium sinecaudum]AMD20657.1 HDL087Cp [Eremothecium sinecaudum]
MMKENRQIVIPDVRVEQNFRKSVFAAARKEHETKVKPLRGSEAQIDDSEVGITISAVVKVVFKDVLLLPLLQGMMWTGLMIAMKPWLRACGRNGYLLGRYIYDTITGRHLLKKMRYKLE